MGLTKVGAAWERTTRAGDLMYSIVVSDDGDGISLAQGDKLLLLTNSYKQAENHPDFNLFLSDDEDDRPARSAKSRNGTRRGGSRPSARRTAPPPRRRPAPRRQQDEDYYDEEPQGQYEAPRGRFQATEDDVPF